VIDESRLSFQTTGLEPDDYTLEIFMKDRVGNQKDEPKSFYFSTLPTKRHDLSVHPVIEKSMDPVIEGNTILFTSIITNQGTMDEENVLVDILVNNEIHMRTTIDSIVAGATRKVTWKWLAVGEGSIFTVKVDPLKTIDDMNPDDNIATLHISTEYRDLTVRSDYLLPSEWNAREGDVITLSIMVVNTGSISTEQFKLEFREGQTFLGMYIINSLDIDSTKEIKFDWIVDNELEFLDVIVDPFNEITESVENNNHVSLKNPFFGNVIVDDDQKKEEDKKDTPEKNEDIIIGEEEYPVEDQGGTIWKGPEENVAVSYTHLTLPTTPYV
jgi:subtilase family serine protease